MGSSVLLSFPCLRPIRLRLFLGVITKETTPCSRKSSMADADPRNSRKRKSQEEAPLSTSALPTANLFRPQPHHPLFSPHVSTSLRLDLNRRQWPNPNEENSILSTPGPFPAQSYTSLMAQGNDQDSLPLCIKEQNDQIDRIIKHQFKIQAEQLSRKVVGLHIDTYRMLQSAADERAGQKLKEKELELKEAKRALPIKGSKMMELEQMVANLKGQLQETINQGGKFSLLDNQANPMTAFLINESKMRDLEHSVEILSAQLQEAIVQAGHQEGAGRSDEQQQQQQQQQQDGESSHVNPAPERAESTMTPCRLCRGRVATVMLLPCGHVCVCRRCDTSHRGCPVCGAIRSSSVEVSLPPYLQNTLFPGTN